MSGETEFFTPGDALPTRSYAEANRELVASFVRYMESRQLSENTIRKYADTCARFIEGLGSLSAVEANRTDIRVFLSRLLRKGLMGSSIQLHTAALKSFYRFVRMAGLTAHDPTLLLARRKVSHRIPRVLSVAEVEALINAARDPFERAVPEVLYSAGCRVSELVGLELKNVDLSEHIVLFKHTKGRTDRYVPFGQHAARAIFEYLRWRPSRKYLFEAPARNGRIHLHVNKRKPNTWYAQFYVNRIQGEATIGSVEQFPTKEQAREAFNRMVQEIPGFQPVPSRPYSTAAIRNLLNRLAHRAGIGHVHPHSLRRACACHMLSSGADIRSIQVLLGHKNIRNTQIYTTLTADELKKIHETYHPHEQGRKSDGEKAES